MKFIKYILPCIAACSLVTSCDNYDEGDRLLDVEVTHSERVVLIQEFSGQRCFNCPTGATRIHDIINANPGKVVAVAMYPFAMDELTAPYGKEIVRSQIATEYFNYYGRPSTLPCASFDGSPVNDNIDTWSAAVLNAFSAEPPASIYLSGNFDSTSRNLTMNAKVEFTDNYSGDCSLILLVTESGIVGPQLMPDRKRNMQYEFNHVLRSSLNGTWGESIGSGKIGESTDYSATGTLADTWVESNCAVVAILINTSTRQVLQAQEMSLSEI